MLLEQSIDRLRRGRSTLFASGSGNRTKRNIITEKEDKKRKTSDHARKRRNKKKNDLNDEQANRGQQLRGYRMWFILLLLEMFWFLEQKEALVLSTRRCAWLNQEVVEDRTRSTTGPIKSIRPGRTGPDRLSSISNLELGLLFCQNIINYKWFEKE